MAVRDPRESEQKTPPPRTGQTDDKATGAPKEKDPIEEIEQATYRGERLRAFRQSAGIRDEPKESTSRIEEKLGVNVGDIVQSQNTLIASLIDKYSTAKGATSDPFTAYIIGELKELKQKYEQGTPDPIEQMTATAAKLDSFVDSLKKRLGIPESSHVPTSDLPSMIELKRLEIEASQRHDQFQQQLEEQKHRWQQEDLHWQVEYGLKKAQFEKDEERKDKAMGRLGELAGSIIESIETEEGYEAPAKKEKAAQPPAQERIIKPKKIKCACGKMLEVPADAVEVECKEDDGGCGSIYDMVEVTREAEAAQD